MKRFCSAIGMCLITGQVALWGQDGAPSMALDNLVKDFGKVMQGETIRHIFAFSNEGSGTLEILSVGPSCGCQATSLSAKQIQPGQRGQIEVSVDTTILTGAINESVNIITNDPQRPSVFLSIKAEVQPEIRVSSPSIYFENVAEGEEAAREVILAVAPERSIKIMSAEPSDASVIVRLEPVSGSDGKKVKLIATYKSDGKIGYRLESITVKTTSYITPELPIYMIIRNFKR